MTSIFLTTYTIRLIDCDPHNRLTIDNFNGGSDLFNIMQHSFNSLHTSISNDVDLQRTIGVQRYTSSARTMAGIIQSGAYGFESDLVNVDSGTISHHRTVDEADILPFYFLVHLPNNLDEGVLILQRFGINGIKTIFTKHFSTIIEDDYPNIVFEINPLIPGSFLANFARNGRFTKIRFIKFGVPHDYAEVYAHDGHIESDGYFEQSITVPRGHGLDLLDHILRIFHNQLDVKSMYEIPGGYNNVKVEVEFNGRYRIMDLSHLDRFKPNYDITDEVDIGTDGHPSYNSINGIARGLLNDILHSIGTSDAQ